jgi:hypothetical protein
VGRGWWAADACACRDWRLARRGSAGGAGAWPGGFQPREYHIPDFSHWKNQDAFEAAFARLLRDLKAINTPPLPAPAPVQPAPTIPPMSTRAHIEELIAIKTRRLQHLEQQQAYKGTNTPTAYRSISAVVGSLPNSSRSANEIFAFSNRFFASVIPRLSQNSIPKSIYETLIINTYATYAGTGSAGGA